MTFLLGRQAMLGHDPPTYRRSTTASAPPLRGQRPGQELAGRPAAQDDHVVFLGLRHVFLLYLFVSIDSAQSQYEPAVGRVGIRHGGPRRVHGAQSKRRFTPLDLIATSVDRIPPHDDAEIDVAQFVVTRARPATP